MAEQEKAANVSIHAPLARSNQVRFADACGGDVSIHAPLARSNGNGGGESGNRGVSIHAPLARSNDRAQLRPFDIDVSIHAPLARCNRKNPKSIGCFNVSIHAPLAMSNIRAIISARWFTPFQYMLLLRGATCSTPKIFMRTCFNTCSSCEEQHEPRNRKSLRLGFNTCSSCEEQLQAHLQPLPPLVSIHAPLARSN